MPVEERLGDPRSVCVLLSVEWIAHLWPKYIIVWWCGGNLCCFHCRTEVKCLSVLSWHSILLLGTKDHTKRPKTPLPITLFFLQRQTFVFFTKIKNKSLLNSIAKEHIYSFGCWGHDTHTPYSGFGGSSCIRSDVACGILWVRYFDSLTLMTSGNNYSTC